MPKILKQILVTVGIYSLILSLLYYFFNGKSGGDLAMGFFAVIFLLLFLIFLGLYTFNKNLQEKIGYVIGLVLCFILFYITIHFLIY